MPSPRLGVLVVALLASSSRFAGAALFNDVLPGAKPMAMGQAYTAVADDLWAMYYNPGALAGSDFTSIGTSLARMISQKGPLSLAAAAYHRPMPLRADSVVGASFMMLREGGGGDKDQFILHYSEPVRVPQLYLTRPLKAGANVKIISLHGGKKDKKQLTLGLDAGVLLETNFGLKGGVAVRDLTSDIGVPNPTLALGAAYTFLNRYTLAADMHARNHLTEFYPALEASFYQGLLKTRIGKGLRLNGVSNIAFGFGVNFSPVVIDAAMTVPFEGFTRQTGAYQLSVSYKFGAPPFYGRFVGSAARQAEDLKSELLVLEDRKRTLETQAAAAQTTKESLDGQLRSMEGRARSLQEQLRSLEIKVEQRKFELEMPKPKPEPPPPAPVVPKSTAPAKPAAAPFPRKHTVAVGDTLRSIAAQHYGDPTLWELIYNANPSKIDRGLPREGEILLIPPPK